MKNDLILFNIQKEGHCLLPFYVLQIDCHVLTEYIEVSFRFSVYDMAIDFEIVCSRITGVKVGTFQYPDVENTKEEHYGKPDEAKYQISMPHDQIKKIQADYQNAVKQFMAEME